MKYYELRKEVVRLCKETYGADIPIENVYLTTIRKKHICHAADINLCDIDASELCDSPKKAIIDLVANLKAKNKARKAGKL